LPTLKTELRAEPSKCDKIR